MSRAQVQRVALWCAPSQYPSTLLRAFAACEGVAVSDEPLAAAHLEYMRRFHGESVSPSFDDLATWNTVVDELLGNPPVDEWDEDLNPPLAWAQKHVANQLLLHTKRDWLECFRHVFVLRDPRAQLTMTQRRRGMARLEDTCIPHQLAIYRWVLAHLEEPPLVLLEEDLVRSPQEALTSLCDSLELPFDPGMLEPAPHRAFGDACWYTEEAPTHADESQLDEIANQYPDLMSRCYRMQSEMMAHWVTPSGSDPVSSRGVS